MPALRSRPGFLFFMVDLDAERARVAQAWNASQAPRVTLSVAAAFTFHQAHRNGKAQLSDSGYAGALDIAAAALSALLPIYVADGAGQPVALHIDLARHRFRGGAAELQCADGRILAPLAIVRNDVLRALTTIEASGIEFLAPR